MQGKWGWRWIYTKDLPKLQSMLKHLEERLRIEFPRVLKHLNANYLEVSGTFSPLFMTLFVYMTPFETAAKLFELFILDGESVLLKMLLRMVELKERKILGLEDMHLQ